MSTISYVTIEVPNKTVRSTWYNNASGKVSNITTDTKTATVTIPAIPVGAIISRALLTVTISTAVGGVTTLTANGRKMFTASVNTVDLTSDVSGSGSFTITYVYKSSGKSGLSEGTHASALDLTNASLEIEYVTGSPDPTPEEDPAPDTALQTDGQIVLYSGWTEEFGGTFGQALLTPSECTVTQEAGGEYSLSLTHPITPDGRWRGLVPFAIVRVPVPAEDTPFIDGSGEIVTTGLEIWRALANAGWYTTTRVITKPTWQPNTYYATGSYCRWNGYNWKCIASHTSQAEWSATTAYWKNNGTGQPSPARKLPEWTRLYVSDSSGPTYLYVKLSTGETGYVKISEASFIREATPEDIAELSTEERHITDQPFRLTEVTVDGNRVTARGQHISYDGNLWLLGDVEILDETIGDAILDVKAALIGETTSPGGREPFRIFAQNTGNTISASYSGKTPPAAILDPDVGLVPLYRSRLVRDNWDFFLVSNEPTDRGFRLTYGVNLTGINWSRDFSGLITRIMPEAKDADGNPYHLPEVFVDSPEINNYPVRAYQVLKVDAQVGKPRPDGEGDWTEVQVIAEMRSRAQDRYLVDHADQPDVELTVEFAAIGQTAGAEQYRGLERVSLYDTVTVHHPDLELDTTFQVKAYEWDAIRQRFVRLTLGNVFQHGQKTIPGYEIGDGAITLKKLDALTVQALRGGST